MKVGALTVLVFMVVSACNSQRVTFESMSEDELIEHNYGLAFEDQVYCVDDARTGSNIRRRTCATFREWAELENGTRTGRLRTPSSNVSYGR